MRGATDDDVPSLRAACDRAAKGSPVMTTHVDFSLRAGATASVQFTAAPLPMSVKITRTSGEELAAFASGDAASPRPLPAGDFRVSAFYRAGTGEWIPIDVDVNEDTATRGLFRCSAYVGSTLSAAGSGPTKLEAVVTVAKS
jgi:hypothetical protein